MEVRSEPGVMPFNISMQKSPIQTQPITQNMRLVYSQDGAAIYNPITTVPPSHPAVNAIAPPFHLGGGGSSNIEVPSSVIPPACLNINTGEPVKRKRGRPRKYAPDGTTFRALNPLSSASSESMTKTKGQPTRSSKKQQMAALEKSLAGSAGIGFTPHVITVKIGEDVSSKIMSFAQHGPQAVCILSANGTISNVTLRQAEISGGTVTYEGRFEILSLSGSFLLSDSEGQRSRTGGLSVSFASSDGRVLGGCVAGLLTAASPVQVFAGSFLADAKQEAKQISHVEPVSAPTKLAPVGAFASAGKTAVASSSPPSRGILSEFSGETGSPLDQNTGTCNNGSVQGFLTFY